MPDPLASTPSPSGRGPCVQAVRAEFVDPPLSSRPFAFWFWNDDLDEGELLRQLRAFAAAGLGGVAISARIGLARRIGYLTPEYFRLVRRAVEECRDLGLRVMLYDEASYPSGSANGEVVASDPRFAARCLLDVSEDVDGPYDGYWRPSRGRSMAHRVLSASVGALRSADVVDGESVRGLELEEPGVVRVRLGPGRWRLMACLEGPSGGTIRGAYADQEDGTALAPPAADLLNPAAVERFIALTHDRYAAALGDLLGSTVVAMFTDEPDLLGRRPARGARPWTDGLLEELTSTLGWTPDDVRAWLPALWNDLGPTGARFRAVYEACVQQRLSRVFYAAQAAWCRAHGIALTGHPARGNEMGVLREFDWPGQDAVWRWVLPWDGTGLEGAESVTAKAASSMALLRGGRPALTEVFGAYGWGLTLDEVKWLLDWHLARGVDTYVLHAYFYSVRGQRAFESEPDLGLHNPWWPNIGVLHDYLGRMSLLLRRGRRVVRVGILADPHDLPWRTARRLYEAQLDFCYLDDEAVAAGRVDGGSLVVGDLELTAVIDERPADLPRDERADEALGAFARAGGVLVPADAADLVEVVRAAASPLVEVESPASDVRIVTTVADETTYVLVFNEGETTIETRLRIRLAGCEAEWWDALDGSVRPIGGIEDGVALRLGRRESRVLVLRPGGVVRDAVAGTPGEGAPESARLDPTRSDVVALDEPWRVETADGRSLPLDGLGDWTRLGELERFAGTLVYRTTVRVPYATRRATLDLGTVGDHARVVLDGNLVGLALWEPYRVEIEQPLTAGQELELRVEVTNSAANYYEGAMRPSGLLGPVHLELHHS